MINEKVLNYQIDYSQPQGSIKVHMEMCKARNTVTGENVAVKVLNVVKLREKGLP